MSYLRLVAIHTIHEIAQLLLPVYRPPTICVAQIVQKPKVNVFVDPLLQAGRGPGLKSTGENQGISKRDKICQLTGQFRKIFDGR